MHELLASCYSYPSSRVRPDYPYGPSTFRSLRLSAKIPVIAGQGSETGRNAAVGIAVFSAGNLKDACPLKTCRIDMASVRGWSGRM